MIIKTSKSPKSKILSVVLFNLWNSFKYGDIPVIGILCDPEEIEKEVFLFPVFNVSVCNYNDKHKMCFINGDLTNLITNKEGIEYI